jgi:hypothetical protein
MSEPDDLEQFAVPAEPEQPPAAAPPDPMSRETKLAFLAHILTGAPFMQRYEVANVGFLEFATVSSHELDRLRQIAGRLPTQELQHARFRELMSVACLNRVEIDHRIVTCISDREWINTTAYDEFLHRLPVGLLHIIESHYFEFSRVLSTLISKVSDRSFWPTP